MKRIRKSFTWIVAFASLISVNFVFPQKALAELSQQLDHGLQEIHDHDFFETHVSGPLLVFVILLLLALLAIVLLDRERANRNLRQKLEKMEGIASRWGTDYELVAERLKMATRVAQIGLWDWDFVTNKLVWDESMYKLYGWDPDDFPGTYEGWRIRVHPDDLNVAEETLEEAVEEEKEYNTEFRIILPDKSVHYIRAIGAINEDPDGKGKHFIGVNWDITDRRKAYQEEKERLRLASMEADIGVYLTSPTTLSQTLQHCAEAVVNHLDAAFARVWILNEKEQVLELRASAGIYTHLDGPHSRVLVGEFKIGRIVSNKRPHLTNNVIGDPQVGDQEWAKREGMVSFAGFPLTVDDRIEGVIAIFARNELSGRTLTALERLSNTVALGISRMSAEKALLEANEILKESEVYNRMLFDNFPIGLALCRMNGDLVDANSAYAEILGRTNEETLELSYWEITPIEYSEQEQLQLDSLQNTGKYGPYEKEYLHKDGYRVPVRLSGLILERKGEKYIWSTVEDVTEERQISEEIQSSKEAAEAANRAKSNFLANMSHEIRTPMNAVIGLTDLALKTESEAKRVDYLKKVHQSSKSLLGIINDILDFSKIEAGKVTLESVQFDLDSLVKSLLNMFSRTCEEKGIRLFFDFPKKIPHSIVGDPQRLRQVLINVIGNALKFTEKGQITIGAKILNQTPREIAMVFSVTDTGIGMSQEQMDKVFKAFEQGSLASNKKFGGTGLGLSICEQLVELMGGTICVESELGKGSSFSFSVKFKIPSTHLKPQVPVGLKGFRILVVDDEEEMLSVLGSMLINFGLRPCFAGSIAEAISILEQSTEDDPIRLVLMDWNMPDTEGTSGIKQIQVLSDLPVIPEILLMSGFWSEEMRMSIESCGIDGFLLKPFSSSTLLDMIIQHSPEKPIGVVDLKMVGALEVLPNLSHASILLAEDNKLNQDVALGLLEETGCKVTIAENGAEVVQAVSESHFDLILMDIQMPKMNGYEATEQIRSWEKECRNKKQVKGNRQQDHVPIVAMTASTLIQEKQRAFDVGMDDHISKPIDPEVFFTALNNWIPQAERPEISGKSSEEGSLPEWIPTEVADNGHSNLEDFGTFPGIDVAVGLSHMLGNKERFLRLLRKFLDHETGVANRIRAAMEEGDLGESTRIAHSLKGLAGTIGATKLQECASNFEMESSKGGIPEMKRHLTQTEEALEEVLEGLKQLPPADPCTPTHQQITNVTPLLSRLSALLMDGDSKAVQCMAELEHTGIFPGNCKDSMQLKKLIHAYAFEEAMEVLQSIILRMKARDNDE